MAKIIDGRGEYIELHTRRGASLSFELDMGDPGLEASDVSFLINNVASTAFTVVNGIILIRIRRAMTLALPQVSSYSVSPLDADGEPEPIVYGPLLISQALA